MDFTVIGLLGPAGSGKDLVGDWFVDKGLTKVSFADPMKRFVQRAFGLTTEQLWGPSEERNREMDVDPSWWFNASGNMQGATNEILNEVLSESSRVDGYLKLMDWFTGLRRTHPEKISTRVILQTLGTEWGREVDPLMWARYAHRVAKRLAAGFHTYTPAGGREEHGLHVNPPKGVVIPDHRFNTEIQTTQENGGYVIRLRRLALEEKTVGREGHKSEHEQKHIGDEKFDLVLELPEGVDKVHERLEAVLKEEAWTIKRRHRQQAPSL